jgi:hypothetical protein
MFFSLRGELPWAVRSPDLCLWLFIKAKVYTNKPQAVDDFKIALREQISAIPENMAGRALGNMQAGLEECVRSDGQHLSDALFETKLTET